MTENNNHLCFVDSNIWLYAFSTNQKEETKRILAKQLIKEKSIIISTQAINEVCRNLLKKHKLDEKSIYNLIASFWDSLIVACALSADVNILYSEDMQDGLTSDKKLTIINPFNFN